MLKCIEKVKAMAESAGATVDLQSVNRGFLNIDAPKGYLWAANGCSAINVTGESSMFSMSYWTRACNEAMSDMREGLRKCDAEEVERLSYDLDEDWTPAADAPEFIAINEPPGVVRGVQVMTTEKCFACDKPLPKSRTLVMTTDWQRVYVGPDCYRKVAKAGEDGYQPPLGGPRLLLIATAHKKASAK